MFWKRKQMMTQSVDSKDSKRQAFSSEDNAESAEAAILKAVRSIRYGSVEIIIHDSRIVQIECKKKIRVQAGIKTN
jgi:hypothetical protein